MGRERPAVSESRGGGLTLVFTLPARPGAAFTAYRVPLGEAGWKRNTRAGAAATASDMTTVLGALTNIYIRGEYLLSTDDVGAVTPLAIELKLWLEVPGPVAIGLSQAGADGSLVFPAGLNQNVGPFNLFPVAPTMPRGTYAFNCRMVNPVTGALLAEDINTFDIH